MSQILVPTSDIAKSNLRYSSGSIAYSLLNTGYTSGYIYSPDVGENYGSGYATMHITDPTGTPGSGDVIIRAYVKSSWSGKGYVYVDLYQGTTYIARLNCTSLASSFGVKSYALTSGEKANISNWSDVRLKVTVVHNYFKMGDQNEQYDTYCAYCELEVPDAAAGGPEICLEMGCAA